MRFESTLTRDDVSAAYAAGCRMMRFGLESGSQRLLNRMGKGTTIEVMERILEWCSDAGMFTTCFMFFGFPGETKEDIDETLSFIRRNQARIGYLSFTQFRLERLSDVYRTPQQFGVATLNTKGHELSAAVNYTMMDGTSGYPADKAVRLFLKEFSLAPFVPIFLSDAENFSKLLTDHYGAAEGSLGARTRSSTLFERRDCSDTIVPRCAILNQGSYCGVV